MSQFGMNMPGASGRRAASVNVYTGLLAAAVVALAAACVYVFMQASTLGVDGQAWGLQKSGDIRLKDQPRAK